MKQNSNESAIGVASALAAYGLWGVLPIYWKLLGLVSAGEILAHRIIWSLAFLIGILIVSKKVKSGIKEIKNIMADKQQSVAILLASLLISLNWFLFIWAVNNNHMVETSLGYYINPLVSVLLGIIFLKEKLTQLQMITFILAAVGVINLVLHFGSFPWVAFSLAISFGLYGLLKKFVHLGAIVGLTIETLVITPFALIYLVYIYNQTNVSVSTLSISEWLLLMGGGVATAVPLLLFATGVRRIPLSMIGFLQYIAPTLMLIIGVFVYDETFTKVHLISFIFIWLALLIFSLSNWRLFLRPHVKSTG
ncbi:EamA family transporter RarD [Bacillus sp. Marseille-P3661]|uniref:EamA family transporter RarD n=1 Tax=Bacillus sp. Marseille-P3661 TaxID=1936234 RepID=UPI000C83D209|nr:EamA family transporter RarD [Bacillus sp. Marseille-P3661]